MGKTYYLIGSLRNPLIPQISASLRSNGVNIFDSWYAAGPLADDAWKEYEQGRELSYAQALKDYAAQHVFSFDKKHLDRCNGAILVYPAGKSAHLELGYVLGQGKPGYVLLDDYKDRWDIMLNFATAVYSELDDLVTHLRDMQ